MYLFYSASIVDNVTGREVYRTEIQRDDLQAIRKAKIAAAIYSLDLSTHHIFLNVE